MHTVNSQFLFQIPSDPYSKELSPSDNQDIETMCMSPAEETLAVSTDRGQLYSISLSAMDMNQVKHPCPGAYLVRVMIYNCI